MSTTAPHSKSSRKSILERFSRVDALVNGAGGNPPEATTSPERSFFKLTEAALRAVIDLNLMGTILPSQVFAEPMAEQGEGVILNITSMNAFRPLTRIPAYSAAKAGVCQFHAVARRPSGAGVFAAHPRQRHRAGLLPDGAEPLPAHRPESGELTPRGQAIQAHTPMGRFGQPGDLVGTLLWLLSPASAFVTGAIIPIDGGFSAFGGV